MYYTIPSPDGGPIYLETNFNHVLPEPFNTITSFLFTLLSVFWFLKLKKEYENHLFLGISSIILFLGSIGGTLYHGLRKYHFFLVMDYLPIMILCFLAATYFLFRCFNQKGWVVLVLTGYFILIFGLWNLARFVPSLIKSYSISLNYGLMALMVIGSTWFFLNKTNYQSLSLIYRAISSFGIALFFRIADPWNILPMGTHFLWHIFGLMATAFIFQFIYQTDNLRVLENPVRPSKIC